jgi:hypothetical protein
MEPLWKLCSGKFAGWNSNGILYDANGENIGYFNGKIAVGCDGQVVGEMYNDKFIGYNNGIAYSLYGTRGKYANIAVSSYADYAGSPIAGWEDPHF